MEDNKKEIIKENIIEKTKSKRAYEYKILGLYNKGVLKVKHNPYMTDCGKIFYVYYKDLNNSSFVCPYCDIYSYLKVIPDIENYLKEKSIKYNSKNIKYHGIEYPYINLTNSKSCIFYFDSSYYTNFTTKRDKYDKTIKFLKKSGYKNICEINFLNYHINESNLDNENKNYKELIDEFLLSLK